LKILGLRRIANALPHGQWSRRPHCARSILERPRSADDARVGGWTPGPGSERSIARDAVSPARDSVTGEPCREHPRKRVRCTCPGRPDHRPTGGADRSVQLRFHRRTSVRLSLWSRSGSGNAGRRPHKGRVRDRHLPPASKARRYDAPLRPAQPASYTTSLKVGPGSRAGPRRPVRLFFVVCRPDRPPEKLSCD